MTPSPGGPKRFGLSHGIAFVIAGHIVMAVAAMVTSSFLFLAFGIVQLLYVVPIVLIALVQGETKAAQGALLGAGLTLLLNGVWCAGILGAFRHV